MGVHTNVQEAETAGAHSKRGNDEAAEESIGAHLMGDLIHPPPPLVLIGRRCIFCW